MSQYLIQRMQLFLKALCLRPHLQGGREGGWNIDTPHFSLTRLFFYFFFFYKPIWQHVFLVCVRSQILQMKVSKLEHLLHLKDMRIEDLTQHLKTYKAKSKSWRCARGQTSSFAAAPRKYNSATSAPLTPKPIVNIISGTLVQNVQKSKRCVWRVEEQWRNSLCVRRKSFFCFFVFIVWRGWCKNIDISYVNHSIHSHSLIAFLESPVIKQLPPTKVCVKCLYSCLYSSLWGLHLHLWPPVLPSIC